MAISLKKAPQPEEAAPTPAAAPAPVAETPAAPVAEAPAAAVAETPAAPAAPAAAPSAAEAAAAASMEAEAAEAETDAEEKTSAAQKILGPLKRLLGPLGRVFARHRKASFAVLGVLLLVVGALAGGLTFWDKYQFGRMMSFYVQGKYAQASRGFEQYLEVNPNDTSIMRMLAIARFNGAQHELSERMLNRLQTNYEEFEDHPEIWYRKALLELSRPSFGEASANLDNALESDGNHVQSLYMRAALAAGEGLHEEAKLAFERIRGLMEESNLDELEALILAREVDYINNLIFKLPAMGLSSAPDLPSLALTSPVPLSSRTGLQVDAAGFNNRYYVPLPLPPQAAAGAVPLAGMEQLIAVNLARQALIGEGDLKVARDYVRKLTASPENQRFGAYLGGYLAAGIGEYGYAVTLYQRLHQRLKEETAHPYILEANAGWAQSGGALPQDDTLALYETALNLDPSNPLALNNLAFFKIYKGEDDEALALLQRAFDNHPGEKIGLNMALIEIERGNAQEARNKLYSLVENVGEDNLVLTRALVIAELALGLDRAAAEGLARWKRLEPDSPTPYLMAAEIHRRTGQQLLWLHELREGLELFPQRHEFSANLVFAHLSLNDADAAKKAMKQIPESARDSYLALAARGLLLGLDNPGEAVNLLAQAQAVAPLSGIFAVAEARARFLVENDRPKEADKAIRDAVDKVGGDIPPQLRALQLRALAATDKSAADAVSEEAREMIAQADANFHADRIVDLARALMTVGRVRDAADVLESLLKDATNTRASEAAYDAYKALGREDDAAALKRRLDHLKGEAKEEKRDEDVVENAQTFLIGSANDFSRQLNAALAADDPEKAVALYTQVIETGKPKLKNSSRTHLNRGGLYFLLKKYAEAAEDFAKAEQLGELSEKETALRSYQHAFALQRMGNHEDAIAELEKALAYDAKNLQYRSLHGHLLRRAERLDEAEKVLRDLLRESPLQESAYLELADMLRRERNDNDGAIRVLKSLVEVSPQNVRAHRMLTDLYVSNGQPDKAEQHRNILKTL